MTNELRTNEPPAALLPEGRRIAIARDEFFASLSGATLSGAPTGVYLRNRLELAFIEGWKAAKLDDSTAPAASESRGDALMNLQHAFAVLTRHCAKDIGAAAALNIVTQRLIEASESRGSVPDGVTHNERVLCEAIVRHQFQDARRDGRLTIDVETLLHEYNEHKVSAPTPPAVASGEPPDWAIVEAVFQHFGSDRETEDKSCDCDFCKIIRNARELARSAAAKGEG